MMRKCDRKALGKYVRWIANEMELRDWTFNVVVGRPDSPLNPDGHEWGASCGPIPGRKAATLTFAPWLRDGSREDLRQCVVHELTHCHFFGLWDTARRDTLAQMGQGAYDVWIAGVERHMEYGVDAMADALAKHLPLIEWPD